MNKTVLAAMVSVAGLAVSAYGQGTQTGNSSDVTINSPLGANGVWQIEARLIVDGQAGTPSGAGITSFVPGPGATRVGITLQARVSRLSTGTATTTGFNNYGIGGILNASSNSLSRFSHIDSQYPGGYQALGRGQTTAVISGSINGPGGSGDSLPQAGFFGTGSTDNPSDTSAGRRDFRFQGLPDDSAADVNGLQTNGAGINGSSTGLEANAANGAFGIGPANGYAVGAIIGLASSVQATGMSAAPTAYALNTFSPFYNLYRVYFDPQVNSSDPARNVTVLFDGLISALIRSVNSLGGGKNFTIPGSGQGTGNFTGLNQLVVSFQVPTPGAMALLGLGGLVAGRRRRA